MHDHAYRPGLLTVHPVQCTIVHRELLATGIGRRVREAREALGLRQDELALAAGVSTRVVHMIEAGKPTSRLDSIERVLGALGLTLAIVEGRMTRPPGDSSA